MSGYSWFAKMKKPAVAADVAVFAKSRKGIEILLIKRKNAPFKDYWAIPGGFIEIDEELEKAAVRELREETGLRNIRISFLGVFGDPKRDPRGRVIGIVYCAYVPKRVKIKAGDDAKEARWFPVSRPPKLAFDHKRIIRHALKMTRK